MVNNHNPIRQVSLLLHVLCKLIQQYADVDFIKRSTNLSLSKRQFEILKILFVSGSFSVSELAKFLRISRAAASKSINNLVRHGLVERNIPSLDRRMVLVSILSTGESIVKQYFDLSHKQEVEILNQFNDEELQNFEKILYRYINALMNDYQNELELICLSCHSKFSEACPLHINEHTSCYHAIVEAPVEITG